MDTKSWNKPKANPPNNHMLLSRQWMLKIIEGLWHAGKQSYTLVVMFVILFLLFFFLLSRLDKFYWVSCKREYSWINGGPTENNLLEE